MSCCPSITKPYADVVGEIETGDVIFIDNDRCAIPECFQRLCCCFCLCSGIDVNNTCCGRSWRRCLMVVKNSQSQVYAFEFAAPSQKQLNNPVVKPTPRDLLTGRVVDAGFRLVPLEYLLRQAAYYGAYVHAHRRLEMDKNVSASTFGNALRAVMMDIVQKGSQITVQQVESLRKQGGPTSVTGKIRPGDRLWFAATNSGYLIFYILNRLSLAKPKKREQFYDVEDVLTGGDLEAALQKCRLEGETAFLFSEIKPPEAMNMV